MATSERDFFKDKFTEQELRSLAEAVPPDELFSWASPSAKPYRSGRGTIPDNDLIQLMLEEPRLIRRPILIKGGVPLLGFRKAEYERLV